MSVPRAGLGGCTGEVVGVSFVHGHGRATGWVVAHVRPPNRAAAGQLPLLAEPAPAGDGEPEQLDRGPGETDPEQAPILSPVRLTRS